MSGRKSAKSVPHKIQDYSELPQKPITLKKGIGGLAGPARKIVRSPLSGSLPSKPARPKKKPVVRKKTSVGGQWTLSGISKSARDTATIAAREEGVKVGEWLERLIRQETVTKPSAEGVDQQFLLDALDDIRQRLNRIEQQRGLVARLLERIKNWSG